MTLKQALQRQRFKQACAKCAGNGANWLTSLAARGGRMLSGGAKTILGLTPGGLARNVAFSAPSTLFNDSSEGGRGWNRDVSQNLRAGRDTGFANRDAYIARGPSTPFVNAARYDLTLPARFILDPTGTVNTTVGGISDAVGNTARSISGMGVANTLRSFAGMPIPGDKPRVSTVANLNMTAQSRSNPVPMTVSAPATPAAPIYKPANAKKATMTKTIPLHVLSVDGKPKGDLDVEVADDDDSKRKGFSKRASLPNDHGMLFACPGPFWMKDVNFPLDIMFLTKQGEILDQQRMWPNHRLQEWQMPRYRCKYAGAAYALEAPGGWCRKHGVTRGDKVLIDKHA